MCDIVFACCCGLCDTFNSFDLGDDVEICPRVAWIVPSIVIEVKLFSVDIKVSCVVFEV